MTMEVPEIVEFARNFATMVRVKGADPKGLKMRNHAFHNHNSGTTTLSASGMLLPDNICKSCMLTNDDISPGSAVVVSVASIVEPFVAIKSKQANMKVLPELIPHAQIDVMIDQRGHTKQSPKGVDYHAAQWLPAKILRLVDVPASSLAVELLMEASSQSLERRWEVGWSLGSNAGHPAINAMQTREKFEYLLPQKSETRVRESRQPDLMGQSISRIVFLLVPDLWTKDTPEITISPSCNRGDLLVTLGSPFGILSPVHFFNSAVAGYIANCYPPTSYDRALLMADIHCLPGMHVLLFAIVFVPSRCVFDHLHTQRGLSGMEGSPIFGEQSKLIGLLTRPLRQNGGAEIQLVIPWKAIEAACRDSCQIDCQNEKEVQSIKENYSNTSISVVQSSNRIIPPTSIKKQITGCSTSSLVERVMTSVCLVTVGDAVWASGIVLNRDGLILTNAHLIEPWRYSGKTLKSGSGKFKIEEPVTFFKDSETVRDGIDSEYHKTSILQPNTTSLDHLSEGHGSHPGFRGMRQISVRLDHVDPWVWCPAKVVYVCQGSLDIALLLLESVPTQLFPINVDLSYPTQGSKAFVIGHGLFGPHCGLYPSVSSGVVSQVVKSGIAPTSSLSLKNNTCGDLPAMIQTTAAVHPGSSGGVVVNSAGCMIGLVTSNAKHGGRTILPHMNFSIPCAAMGPIFKFAADAENISLLHELDKPNKKLSSVWSMMSPGPTEPSPSIPGVSESLKEGQGKGSHFAKFIADRKELFKEPNPVKTSKL